MLPRGCYDGVNSFKRVQPLDFGAIAVRPVADYFNMLRRGNGYRLPGEPTPTSKPMQRFPCRM